MGYELMKIEILTVWVSVLSQSLLDVHSLGPSSTCWSTHSDKKGSADLEPVCVERMTILHFAVVNVPAQKKPDTHSIRLSTKAP